MSTRLEIQTACFVHDADRLHKYSLAEILTCAIAAKMTWMAVVIHGVGTSGCLLVLFV